MAHIPGDDDDPANTIHLNCTIINTFSESYGKFEKVHVPDQLILEWEHWLSYFSKYLDERWTSNQDLMNYMQTPGMQD